MMLAHTWKKGGEREAEEIEKKRQRICDPMMME
jgi:hypothetical protein